MQENVVVVSEMTRTWNLQLFQSPFHRMTVVLKVFLAQGFCPYRSRWWDRSIHSFNQVWFTKSLLWAGYCAQCWGYNKNESDRFSVGPYGPYSVTAVYVVLSTFTQDQVHMIVCICSIEFIHSLIHVFSQQFLSNNYDPNTLLNLLTTKIKEKSFCT